MPRLLLISLVAAAVTIPAAAALTHRSDARSERVALPDPIVHAVPSGAKTEEAVFAGGCFWGIEAVFEHVKGVVDVVSGYAGGDASTANYEAVSSSRTGHAESVRVTFDPAQVSYETLLKVFFSVAHDPTQLNRQGPDFGPQYRSAIFFDGKEQERVAKAYIAQLDKAKTFDKPIVTQVTQLKRFYMAEKYHQDYMAAHPNQPYIVINDAPKLVHLREQFPDLYRDTAADRKASR